MRILVLAIVAISFFASCDRPKAEINPEEVIRAIDGYELKYKHLQAYVDKHGGDFGVPSILTNSEIREEIKEQVIREFIMVPDDLFEELDEHYEWMQRRQYVKSEP